MDRLILDARGKMCPWPVLLTSEKLKTIDSGALIEVIVDYPPAKENVVRFAEMKGHVVVDVKEENGQWRIIIKKS